MKRVALSLLAIATCFISVQAQEQSPRKHGMHKSHHFGMMSEKLNLSDDQKTQMKTINEDYRKQMSELKKMDEITVKEYRSRKESIRKDHKTKFQELLTPDQKAQLEKMKADRKSKMDSNGKQRMDKMKEKLGLTDEQVAEMNRNRSDLRERLKAIHDNASLDENEKKQQAREAMKQQKEKMRSILNEEQLKKLKESDKL